MNVEEKIVEVVEKHIWFDENDISMFRDFGLSNKIMLSGAGEGISLDVYKGGKLVERRHYNLTLDT